VRGSCSCIWDGRAPCTKADDIVQKANAFLMFFPPLLSSSRLSDAWILSRSLQYHLVATSSEGLGLKVYTPQQGENTQTRRRGAGITISMDVTDRWEHQKIKTEKTRPSSKRERVAGLKRRYGKCRVTTRRHHHLTLLIHFIHTHVCVCVCVWCRWSGCWNHFLVCLKCSAGRCCCRIYCII
jgi:hypothetical protein